MSLFVIFIVCWVPFHQYLVVIDGIQCHCLSYSSCVGCLSKSILLLCFQRCCLDRLANDVLATSLSYSYGKRNSVCVKALHVNTVKQFTRVFVL